MEEAAGLGLGRQVSALQSHAARISNPCWQCHHGCRDHVETPAQGETRGLSAAGLCLHGEQCETCTLRLLK